MVDNRTLVFGRRLINGFQEQIHFVFIVAAVYVDLVVKECWAVLENEALEVVRGVDGVANVQLIARAPNRGDDEVLAGALCANKITSPVSDEWLCTTIEVSDHEFALSLTQLRVQNLAVVRIYNFVVIVEGVVRSRPSI